MVAVGLCSLLADPFQLEVLGSWRRITKNKSQDFCRCNALLEVIEGIAYNNAPLDLATADGASRNVMALSRGHKVTQTDK